MNIRIEIAADFERELTRIINQSRKSDPDGTPKLPIERLSGPRQIDQTYGGPMVCLMIQCDKDRGNIPDVVRLKKIAGVFEVRTQAYQEKLDNEQAEAERKRQLNLSESAAGAERQRKKIDLQRLWDELGSDAYKRVSSELARPEKLTDDELDNVDSDWLDEAVRRLKVETFPLWPAPEIEEAAESAEENQHEGGEA
jgi:hypothetical protein